MFTVGRVTIIVVQVFFYFYHFNLPAFTDTMRRLLVGVVTLALVGQVVFAQQEDGHEDDDKVDFGG